jgi:putative addiction module component (TIGR02574 family)
MLQIVQWRRNAMATTNDRVIEEALSLPADVRLNLVEKLLTSLNLPIDGEIDRLWAEEAERRVSQIEEGKTKLVPGDEVFTRIRAKHGK